MHRIVELDALRGIALFGILLVNIFVFHAPISYYNDVYGVFEGIQGLAVDLMVNYAGGKFLFIFAFLFGYGIVLLKNSRSAPFYGYFIKRMLILFLFGVLHILLFWFGDILASYALLGLLTLPFLRWSNSGILCLATFFIFFRSLYYFAAISFDWPMIHMDQVVTLEEFNQIFQEGSFTEIFQLRMKDFIAFIPESLVWYMPKSLGLFFLGIYAAQINFFRLIKEKSESFIIATVIFLLFSIAWNTTKMDFFTLFDMEGQPLWRPVLIAINVLLETLQGISYIFGFTLLFQQSTFLSKLFSKAGRLALTNYILQSLLCVFIFYSYGLGYYGMLLPMDLVFISIAIFCFNLIFSHIYLRYKSIGPLEYLWRKWISKR